MIATTLPKFGGKENRGQFRLSPNFLSPNFLKRVAREEEPEEMRLQVSIWISAVVLLWASAGCLLAQNSDAGNINRPVRASVCDVARHPKKYDGRIVEIRGNVSMGFESFVLTDYADASCSETIWLEYADEPLMAPKGRTVLKVVRNAELRYFEYVTGAGKNPAQDCSDGHECHRYDVVATIIGRVDHSNRECAKSAAKRDGETICGYGHMGQWKTQLEIQSVVDVVAKEQ